MKSSYSVQWKLTKTNYKDPQDQFLLSDVLLMRICLLHVYSANLVMLEIWFVLSRNLSKGVRLNEFLLYLYAVLRIHSVELLTLSVLRNMFL